ncbi:MAG TPA: glycerol kinase GlpK [Candidatus Limnocylindrales bacterium]|nr:glycerol kinase GlpK [Candidatus Limnocylindrales bacterium]
MAAERDLVLALDEGTTSARSIVFDRTGATVASAQREFEQRYPSPGDVRHDAEAIWEAQVATAREAIDRAGGVERIAAIGVTNQRETAVVWDRATGRPVADAIVWQSRVTAPFCERLRADGHEALVRSRTGLPIDAYFTGPKIRQILLETPELRDRAAAGKLAAGTIDSYLIARLTDGRVHVTDVSNASRTLLLDIRRGAWDPELLGLMDVPASLLPTVRSSSEVYGESDPSLFGRPIPIAGIAGDQQAATFGQACFEPGDAKVTLGTGAFLLANTGSTVAESGRGLLSTIAWQLGPTAPPTYAIEGSVFVTGAAVQWLRDGLGLIRTSGEVDALAAGAAGSGGVVVVPAFVGLGAPYWDPTARGAILGITRGTGAAEIARATLESIAFQVRDVVEAMDADIGRPLTELRIDGGGAGDTVCGLVADHLGRPVERPANRETTAFGAAALAGLSVGLWASPGDIAALRRVDRRFEPTLSESDRARAYRLWRRAVERARGWSIDD